MLPRDQVDELLEEDKSVLSPFAVEVIEVPEDALSGEKHEVLGLEGGVTNFFSSSGVEGRLKFVIFGGRVLNVRPCGTSTGTFSIVDRRCR